MFDELVCLFNVAQAAIPVAQHGKLAGGWLDGTSMTRLQIDV
jgi:hypothetical protein